MKTYTKIILSSLFVFALGVKAETIDLSKSKITWFGSKLTGDSHNGTIKISSAKVDNGKGQVVIDMKSIDEVNLKGEWKEKFLKHISGEDFFMIEKYPTAKLDIEKIDSNVLYGKLTIKDKTHDVTVPFKRNGKTISGELFFDRTKYNVVYGSGNFFKNLGDKVINDTIKIGFEIVTK